MTADDAELSWMWLRDILHSDWDPIVGCPNDEYDRYAKEIAAMLREGASDIELTNYLNWAETDQMGIFVNNAQRLRRAVIAIRAADHTRRSTDT